MIEKEQRMTRRTFETKDANGCYFKCEAFYNGPETIYTAMGLKASTLKELQKKVAEL